MLQFKSNQAMSSANYDTLTDLASSDPVLFEELSLRRSNTFKDPAKAKLPDAQMWHQVNQYPSKQINKVIRPKILKMEQEGIERIISKLENEKRIEEMQQEWFRQNRLVLREKLKQKHDEAILLERKSGVFKPYKNISPSGVPEHGGMVLQSSNSGGLPPSSAGKRRPHTSQSMPLSFSSRARTRQMQKREERKLSAVVSGQDEPEKIKEQRTEAQHEAKEYSEAGEVPQNAREGEELASSLAGGAAGAQLQSMQTAEEPEGFRVSFVDPKFPSRSSLISRLA